MPHIHCLFCRTNAFGISHYFISPVKEINVFCFCLCTANKWTNNLHVVTVRRPYPNLLTQFHFGILQEDSTGQYKAHLTPNQKLAAALPPVTHFVGACVRSRFELEAVGNRRISFRCRKTYPASSAVQPIAESLY